MFLKITIFFICSFLWISKIKTNLSDMFKAFILFSSVLPSAFSAVQLWTWVLLTFVMNCVSVHYADLKYLCSE